MLSRLIILSIVVAAPLIAQDRASKEQLIAGSDVIAVISLTDVTPPVIEDASVSGAISTQRQTATVLRILKGELPDDPIIQNHRDSILTSGTHLAFLKQLSPIRFATVAPNALYRIDNDSLQFSSLERRSLSEVVIEIEAELKQEK